MTNKPQLRYLLERYLTDQITAGELEELKAHVLGGDMEGTLGDVVDELWKALADEVDVPIASEAIYDGILNDNRVETDPPMKQRARKIRYVNWRWTTGIAALLCAGILVAHYGRWPNQRTADGYALGTDTIQPIVPGGNKAVLTLADGRTVDLNEAQTGIIVGEGITYTDGSFVVDGRLEDDATEKQLPPVGGFELLTLTTQRGGQYQITLSDGTKVWLNSASTLRYPSLFEGKERMVELEGEAYFEVSQQATDIRQQTEKSLTSSVSRLVSNKVPFLVKTRSQTVEVLGTQFNIAAYPDEPEVRTTLVEGTVEVTNLQTKTVNKLIPGNQSVVRGAVTNIRTVDVEQHIAWKNGYFAFNDDHISKVMAAIGRWYDIEVDYQGDLSNTYFGGTISRFEDFESLLETIALTGSVRFKIEGRRVSTMK